MSTVEFQPPDESQPRQQLTADQAASLMLETDFDYWQQGGNGEGWISLPDSDATLLIKQTIQDGYLLTMQSSEDLRVPCSGAGFDEFAWDERGGEPFKVPRSCLVDPTTASRIVHDYATTGGESAAVSWISWYDLPAHYFPE